MCRIRVKFSRNQSLTGGNHRARIYVWYVQSQINKAFQIPRRDTLFHKSKTRNTDRPVFVTTYNPSLPNLNYVIKEYYPILTLSRTIQRYPNSAYRRQKNLRDFLVKAKLKQSPPNNANPPKKLHTAMMGLAVPVSSWHIILYFLRYW